MKMGKIIPAFIAGVGVTLGVPKVKDFYVNNVANYRYPLTNFRAVAPELHLYDLNEDEILDPVEARRYSLAFAQGGKLTTQSLNSLTVIRDNLRSATPGYAQMFSSNVDETVKNLEQVQDEILREQIAKR